VARAATVVAVPSPVAVASFPPGFFGACFFFPFFFFFFFFRFFQFQFFAFAFFFRFDFLAFDEVEQVRLRRRHRGGEGRLRGRRRDQAEG